MVVCTIVAAVVAVVSVVSVVKVLAKVKIVVNNSRTVGN